MINIENSVPATLTDRILMAEGEELDKLVHKLYTVRMDWDSDESLRSRILSNYGDVLEVTKR